MTDRTGANQVERLRERFLSRAGEGSGAGCPQIERIWMAARDELPRGEFRGLVEHAAECPACAAAWRLAREIATEGGTVEAPGPLSRTPWHRFAPVAAVAAAAVVVLGILVAYPWPWHPAAVPAYRAQKVEAIRSLIGDDALLSRRNCVLRWSPGPDGATYGVSVTDADLAPLASARHLDREEFVVPEAALSRVAPGERILWQIVAVLPGGREVVSPTFAARIE